MTVRKAVWIVGVVVCVGASAIAYRVLDLREPRRTRALMDAFRREEVGAWDEYKMDPPRSKRAVPALLEGMRDPNPTVRERALVGVCGLSEEQAVVSALRGLAEDPVLDIREEARRCLRNTYGISMDGE